MKELLELLKEPLLLLKRGAIRATLRLEFEGNVYIRRKKKKQFCPRCFDEKLNVIHLKRLDDSWVQCPACHEKYHNAEQFKE